MGVRVRVRVRARVRARVRVRVKVRVRVGGLQRAQPVLVASAVVGAHVPDGLDHGARLPHG